MLKWNLHHLFSFIKCKWGKKKRGGALGLKKIKTIFLNVDEVWLLRKVLAAWLLVQLMKRWEVTNVGSSVTKRVDLKNSHYTQKNSCNYIWRWMLITFIVLIIARYPRVSNHYAVHLKVICYMSIICKFKKNAGYGIRLCGFRPQLLLSLTAWVWADYFTFLSLFSHPYVTGIPGPTLWQL